MIALRRCVWTYTDERCSARHATGGSIPGLLSQLPDSALNVTGSIGNTGNVRDAAETMCSVELTHLQMFEKFNTTDVNSSGSGGEYTVQVRVLAPYSLELMLMLHCAGWIRVDERCRTLDCGQLRPRLDLARLPQHSRGCRQQQDYKQRTSGCVGQCDTCGDGRRCLGDASGVIVGGSMSLIFHDKKGVHARMCVCV